MIEYRFDRPTAVEEVRIIFDSDLDRETLPGDVCERQHTMRANLLPDAPVMHLPSTLCRAYCVEAELADGSVVTLTEEDNNVRRLVKIKGTDAVMALRFCGTAVHENGTEIRLFSLEAK